MTPDGTQNWYATLIKPPFAPPAWIFGSVWSVLYVLIAISFGYALIQVIRGRWPKKTALPFVINLVANAVFTPIQFGLKNNLLAFIDILIVLITIVWIIRAAYPRAKWVAWMQIPYLLWVSFATVLQASVTWLNW